MLYLNTKLILLNLFYLFVSSTQQNSALSMMSSKTSTKEGIIQCRSSLTNQSKTLRRVADKK